MGYKGGLVAIQGCGSRLGKDQEGDRKEGEVSKGRGKQGGGLQGSEIFSKAQFFFFYSPSSHPISLIPIHAPGPPNTCPPPPTASLQPCLPAGISPQPGKHKPGVAALPLLLLYLNLLKDKTVTVGVILKSRPY